MRFEPRVPLAALLLLTTPLPAWAQYLDGNTLLEWCEKSPNGALGYVLGTFDRNWLQGDVAPASQLADICVPKNTSSPELLDVVCTSIQDKPATRQVSASTLTLEALAEAFPCP